MAYDLKRKAVMKNLNTTPEKKIEVEIGVMNIKVTKVRFNERLKRWIRRIDKEKYCV